MSAASASDRPEDAPAIDVWVCDFSQSEDRASFARLVTEFAAEPVSGCPELGIAHFAAVADELAERDGTIVLLAAREDSEETEGVLVAFEGYSTFAKAQLFNIHDVHVSTKVRGKGIGSAMLNTLADLAREHGFAKLTLEVAASNTHAIRLYRRIGFTGLDTAFESPAGTTFFATKRV